VRELSDQLEGEALELVLLDQLVQVDGQKLKGDAGVGPETNLIKLINLMGPGFLSGLMRRWETKRCPGN